VQDASSAAAVSNFSNVAVSSTVVGQNSNEGHVSDRRHTRIADGSLPDDFFDRFSEIAEGTLAVDLEPLPASFLDVAFVSKSALFHIADSASNELESPSAPLLLSVSVASLGMVDLSVAH
jgi:hypothetical protein